MSNPNPAAQEVEKPELDGQCMACGEWTDAYEPCCGDAVVVDGDYTNWESLQEEWENKTGLKWDECFE